MTDINARGLLMPVMLLCPNLACRKLLSVPEELRGKIVKCQHCQTIVRVPEKRIAEPVAVVGAAAVKK